MRGSLDIEEDNDAGDVVNDALFALPSLERRSYKALGRTLRILLQEEGVDNVCDVLVLEELPDAVTCQHNYLVFGGQCELLDLGQGIDTDSRSHGVAE